MARLSGKGGSVSIGGSVLGVKSWDIDAKGDAVDVTGFDSAGEKEFISGLTEWSGTAECFLDAGGYLASTALGTSVSVSLASSSTAPKVTCSGTAIVTGWKVSVPVEGAVTLSIAFQGSKTLTCSIAAT